MKDLKNALLTKKRYNQMEFSDFVILLENYIGKEIPQKEKDMFEYTGLMNTDFFQMWMDEKNL